MGVRDAPKHVTETQKEQNRKPFQGLCGSNKEWSFLFNYPGIITAKQIRVAPGEDVRRTILTFSRGRSKTVILSAMGSLAGANIRVPNSIDPIRYEGPFNILHLSGTFTHCDVNADDPTGCLRLMFSAPNGDCIVGGVVEGALIASSVIELSMAILNPYPVPDTESSNAEDSDEDNDGEALADHEDNLSSNAAALATA